MDTLDFEKCVSPQLLLMQVTMSTKKPRSARRIFFTSRSDRCAFLVIVVTLHLISTGHNVHEWNDHFQMNTNCDCV
jgi:hypothetical protein